MCWEMGPFLPMGEAVPVFAQSLIFSPVTAMGFT